MGAVAVVVSDILAKQAPKMIRVEHDDMVEELAATTADPAFDDTVLPGAPIRSTGSFDRKGLDGGTNIATEYGIAIEDKILGRAIAGKRLAQLLDDPLGRRVFGDVYMDDVPSFVADDDEPIQESEGNGRDDEEVHGRDLRPMVAQKRHPALGFVFVWFPARQVARDGALGHIEAKLQELAVDARCAPRRILLRHAPDEAAYFRVSARTAGPSGKKAPVPFETGAVPANNGLRFDED